MITGIFQLFGWVLNTCWTLLTAMLSLGWRMLTALLDFACRGVAALGSFLLGPLSGGTDSLWDSCRTPGPPGTWAACSLPCWPCCSLPAASLPWWLWVKTSIAGTGGGKTEIRP